LVPAPVAPDVIADKQVVFELIAYGVARRGEQSRLLRVQLTKYFCIWIVVEGCANLWVFAQALANADVERIETRD
jgi:hypothetical protein